jgi:hypothetical protein
MAKRHSTAPHRTATRSTPLRLVGADSPTPIPPADSTDTSSDQAIRTAIDGLDLPAELADRMLEGFADGAEPHQMVAAMAAGLMHDLSLCRRPLDAELEACELFSTLVLTTRAELDRTAGTDGTGEAVDDDPVEADKLHIVLLAALIDEAAAAGTAAGLSLLRVLSTLGPTRTRQLASAHAERLAAAGVPDPRWASAVGRPTLIRAWRYGDLWGSQSSIGLLFDYSGREHALLTLIDHELGGGVKDCFVAEGRDAGRLHDRTRTDVDRLPDATFEDIDAHTAALELGEALARPVCPVQDDQIETMALNEELLRSRTALLTELAGLPARTLDEQRGPVGHGEILRIKVSLVGIRPPIWRRLEVPASISLERLHGVLQVAFDWSDDRAHRFERPVPTRVRRLLPDADPAAIDVQDERRIRLVQLLPAVGSEAIYRYGGGDDWEHLITVEAREAADSDVGYPLCTGGRRSAPPEDAGGIRGYQHLLKVVAAPAPTDDDRIAERAPAGFDPDAFAAADVNAVLAARR